MLVLLKAMIVALIIVGFTGCAVKTNDIQVLVTKSEKMNLKGYKTYQIVEESGMIRDSWVTWIPDNLDVNTEMYQIINTELAKKGKILVTKKPDFYVVYTAAADRDTLEIKLDKEGKEIMKKVPTAAMLLILIDAETDMIIWIASAKGEVSGLPAEQMKKRLNYAIKKMLNSM